MTTNRSGSRDRARDGHEMTEAVMTDRQAEIFSHALRRMDGAQSVALSDFRKGMRVLAGAVNVLTTIVGSERYGLTATAVCSLSADPPRLLACVNQKGVTFNAMRQSRLLAVNVLSVSHAETAKRFAGMADDIDDRFASGLWTAGRLDSVPVLADACCSFECRVSEIIDSTTHAILVADIIHVSVGEEPRPLVYCDGTFRGLAGQAA